MHTLDIAPLNVVNHHRRKQETQLSVTNRATQLCKCSGVADLS